MKGSKRVGSLATLRLKSLQCRLIRACRAVRIEGVPSLCLGRSSLSSNYASVADAMPPGGSILVGEAVGVACYNVAVEKHTV